MTKLYHRNVFWKKDFDRQSAELIRTVNRLSHHVWEYIDYSNAERRNFSARDIYHVIDELKKMDNVKSFEVETDGHRVTKCCVRVHFNAKKDICIVCRFGKVITTWLCNKDDTHNTLDKRKYTRGWQCPLYMIQLNYQKEVAKHG